MWVGIKESLETHSATQCYCNSLSPSEARLRYRSGLVGASCAETSPRPEPNRRAKWGGGGGSSVKFKVFPPAQLIWQGA